MGATGCARGGWRCCRRCTRPLWVATCIANSCAARGSLCPLEYPQLLATKEITSRDTVGIAVRSIYHNTQERLQHATNEIRDHSPFPLPVSPFATIFSQREREPDGLCSPAFYRPCVTYSQLWNPIWPGIKGHSPTRGPTPTIVWTAPMATPGTYS